MLLWNQIFIIELRENAGEHKEIVNDNKKGRDSQGKKCRGDLHDDESRVIFTTKLILILSTYHLI